MENFRKSPDPWDWKNKLNGEQVAEALDSTKRYEKAWVGEPPCPYAAGAKLGDGEVDSNLWARKQ